MLARTVPALIVFTSLPTVALAAPAPLSQEDPWVLAPDDGLRASDSELLLGMDLAPDDWPEGHWDGDMYFGPESFSRQQLDALDAPLPAMNYEATPGILFLAMDGVNLAPYCGNGDSANSALNCSPLVDGQTSFPSYGSSSQKNSVQQTLESYYADFDLVITQNRPPSYVPYTMAVIGGSSGNAGQGGGVCGIANVACDGLKRNHVSLTFPSSCGGVPAVVAQETSHNWGLEHTDNQNDLLYPYNSGGSKSFVDSCMNISHATGNGVTACTYIHEIYCPNGGGEQQNSYEELMAAFGPRTPDNTAPEIIDIQPPDGSVFTSDDNIKVTAKVNENSNFAGVRWTFTEGVPDSIKNDDGTYTRCTNNTCDDDYNLGLDIDFANQNFDFVNLSGAPDGTYSFTFEVMDAYGNSDTESISFTVMGGSGGTETTVDPTGGSTSSGTTGATATTDASDSDSGTGSGGTTTVDPTTTGPEETTGVLPTASTTTGMNKDDGQCACRTGDTGWTAGWMLLGLVPLVRRRR